MPTRDQSSPLTFEMDAAMGESLQAFATDHSLRSVSAALRLILDSTDLDALEPPEKKMRQFSVRIPPKTRDRLHAFARENNVSIGEIIRTAVSQFLAERSGNDDIRNSANESAKPDEHNFTTDPPENDADQFLQI